MATAPSAARTRRCRLRIAAVVLLAGWAEAVCGGLRHPPLHFAFSWWQRRPGLRTARPALQPACVRSAPSCCTMPAGRLRARRAWLRAAPRSWSHCCRCCHRCCTPWCYPHAPSLLRTHLRHCVRVRSCACGGQLHRAVSAGSSLAAQLRILAHTEARVDGERERAGSSIGAASCRSATAHDVTGRQATAHCQSLRISPPLRARSTARRCAPWPQWRCPAPPRAPAPLLRCARWRCCAAAAPQPRLPATSSYSTATPPSTPRWRRTTSWWWTSTRRCGCSGAALHLWRGATCRVGSLVNRCMLHACTRRECASATLAARSASTTQQLRPTVAARGPEAYAPRL
jgi:hypothetical protein